MSLSSDPMSSRQGGGTPEPMDMLIHMSSLSNYIQTGPIEGCNSQALEEVEDDPEQYDHSSLPIVMNDPESLELSIEELCRLALQQYNVEHVGEEQFSELLVGDVTQTLESTASTTDNLQLEELVTPAIPGTSQGTIEQTSSNNSQSQMDLQYVTETSTEEANMCEVISQYCNLNTQNKETQARSQQSSLQSNQVVTENTRSIPNLADIESTNEQDNAFVNSNLILQPVIPLHIMKCLIPTELTSNIIQQTGNILNNAQAYLILNNEQPMPDAQDNVQLAYSAPAVIQIENVPSSSSIIHQISPNSLRGVVAFETQAKDIQETPVIINLVEDSEADDAIAESADDSNVDQYIQAVSSLQIPNPYECFLCDFMGKSGNSLRNHIAYRHPTKKQVLKCRYCPYVTSFKDYLSHHIRDQHTNSEIHRCLPCSFVTKRKRSLKKHIQCGHQNAQNYTCSQCEFKTKYKENATKHQRHIHDRTFLPLDCYYCDFTTGYGCSMRRHVRTVHKVQEPKIYGCSHPSCEFRCGFQRELLYHVRAKHPKQPELFKCKKCEFSSASKTVIKYHMRRKHKYTDRALQCKICFCETSSLDSLRKHIKTKHAALLRRQ